MFDLKTEDLLDNQLVKMAHFKRLENYFRKFVDTSIYKKLIAHVVHLTMKVLSESVSVPESRYPLLNSRGRS
ncbi:hypothetical protein EMCRGX_G011093 [Ephydatia muelleri]